MELSGGHPRPVTRGVKRATEEEKERIKREKWTMKGFLEPRLTESAINPGIKSILIGRNDMLVDPKNPHKILIPDDTQVKVEVKEEQVTGEDEMKEGPSTFYLQDQDQGQPENDSDRPAGIQTTEVIGMVKNEEEAETGIRNVAPSFPNQISVKVEVDHEAEVRESDQLAGVDEEMNTGGDSNVDWSKTVAQNIKLEPTSQKGCTQCLELEKTLSGTEMMMEEAVKTKKEAEKKAEEKELRIHELEQELEALKQSYQQELSKKMVEGEGPKSEDKTADKKSFDNYPHNNNETAEENTTKSSWKSVEENEIDALVVKASKLWKDKSGESFLHVAARSGNLNTVQYFLSIEAFEHDINAKNWFKSTPIMEAGKAKRNSTEISSLLATERGANTYSSGQNGLFYALTSGKSLSKIEKRFGPLTTCIFKLTDTWNETVLHKAVEQGYLKGLEYYMSLKPSPDDVNARNRKGWTPIMKAINAPVNFSPIVDLLLENGASFDHYYCENGIITAAIRATKPLADIKKLVDVGAPWDKNSILCYCVASDNVKALKYFIKRGVDVNAKTTEGMTPLLTAAFMRRTDLMDTLIEKGAQPLQGLHLTHDAFLKLKHVVGYGTDRGLLEVLEMHSRYGVTWDNWLLHECAMAAKWNEVRYCVLKGADVNSKDSTGKTPLFRAVAARQLDLEMVNFLLSKGANVNVEDKEGFSILYHAAANYLSSFKSTFAAVMKLVDHGATWTRGVVGSGPRKESILHAAVRGRNLQVVEYFVSRGVDVNAVDSNGDTPLILTVRVNGVMQKILRTLADAGADSNARDIDGNNALLIEVGKAKRNMQVVYMLLDIRCDWRVPNNEGVTVFSKLEKEGDSEFLRYFKSLG